MHTDTITEATYTSTITDAPDGAVTVYQDVDGQEYTYGASTIYEVYIYTTTQSIDLVGQGLDCPDGTVVDNSWGEIPNGPSQDGEIPWIPGAPLADGPDIKKQKNVVEPKRKMRRMPRTMAARALPAYVEASTTPVA